jgi:hypothetical protein
VALARSVDTYIGFNPNVAWGMLFHRKAWILINLERMLTGMKNYFLEKWGS